MQGVVDNYGRELYNLLLLTVGVRKIDRMVIVKNQVWDALAKLFFGFVELNDWSFMDGSVLMKTFALCEEIVRVLWQELVLQ